MLDREAHALLKPIENEREYDTAIKVFEALMDRVAREPDSPLVTLMTLLADRIQAYERRVYPMDNVEPQEASTMVVEVSLFTQHNETIRVKLDPDKASEAQKFVWSVRIQRGGLPNIRRSYRKGGMVCTQSLAQLVMGRAPKGMLWTYKNGDPLDNRAENLKAVKPGQQVRDKTRKEAAATSRARMSDLSRNPKTKERVDNEYSSVTKVSNRFRASIKQGGKRVLLKDPDGRSSFATEEEAARAYDDARERLGLSRVNFPKQEGPEQ